MSNPYATKTAFIKKQLVAANLVAIDIHDESLREVILFRKADQSHFVLVIVGYDFRDIGWSIDVQVGKGYPENNIDQFEFQISSISLRDLGVLDDSTSTLQHNITHEQLLALIQPALQYALQFVHGASQSALQAIKKRNRQMCQDPLSLDTDNRHLKNLLNERNEELKCLYEKYC